MHGKVVILSRMVRKHIDLKGYLNKGLKEKKPSAVEKSGGRVSEGEEITKCKGPEVEIAGTSVE